MNISIFIVDDEYHAVEQLKGYVLNTPGLILAGTSGDPLEALERITAIKPEVTFLDIGMPVMNGLTLAKLIRNVTRIVFTTSYREYGPESYDLKADDYLLKPITFERFLECIHSIRTDAISETMSTNNSFSFFVKTEAKGKLQRIIAQDILFIEADGNYVKIYLSGQVISAYLTLREIMEKLPHNMFLRIHRSFIINPARIKSIEAGQVFLEQDHIVPIGRDYKKAFLQNISDPVFSSYREQ
ncbi:DNA-binding LytR/AlgR family response regulator [Mucilaginibacter sp. OAE612]|uniref:LytR/AlgR family response regulator transcription factor n=1 Tax=Mucilaginibacter sp. OAE612 TaxID=3156444 RepID=UPI00359CDA0A